MGRGHVSHWEDTKGSLCVLDIEWMGDAAETMQVNYDFHGLEHK